MLVSFIFENWRSYREKTTLSMLADRSRQHTNTLAIPAYYRGGIKIIPVAAVYGGNAAGKSNLFSALQFVQRFVVLGRQDYTDIPIEPFEVGTASSEPSRFSIEILVNQEGEGIFQPTRIPQSEIVYRLEFTVTRNKVLTESLFWLDSKKIEHPIYSRNENDQFIFAPDLLSKLTSSQRVALDVIAGGTGERRLFLTNVVGQQNPLFNHIYQWFTDSFKTADGTDAAQLQRMTAFMDDDKYCEQFSHILRALGTGIDQVKLESVSDNMIPLSVKDEFDEMVDGMPANTVAQITLGTGNQDTKRIYLIKKSEDGSSIIQQVQTYRRGKPFGFDRESTGTRRLIEMLPILMDLWTHKNRTWILDEMGRDFHTDMTQTLLQAFLNNCGSDTRTQLLLNTHDLMLMDQSLFRKDEIFVVDRDDENISHLNSLSNCKGIRNDLDLRRSYLDGKFGGRPHINKAEFDSAIVSSERE